ncbi:MAG: uridine kinase [Bacteriovoracaceae bacterium]|nr:uridine kinase [Bacteriovoracaceae bacterium]
MQILTIRKKKLNIYSSFHAQAVVHLKANNKQFSKDHSVYLIGIAGGSGSGKTTFASKVLSRVPNTIGVLHMDSYYLPSQPKTNTTKSGKPNFDHPDAFDWNLLRTHIRTLKDGGKIKAPVYDFTTSSRSEETQDIGPATVVILEGIFTLFDQDIREMLDIQCFLYVDSDIRFTRRLHRDVKERGRSLESVIEQYYETVRPMYQKFLAPQRQYADFIVGEETDIAADILSAKINEMIKNPRRKLHEEIEGKGDESKRQAADINMSEVNIPANE